MSETRERVWALVNHRGEPQAWTAKRTRAAAIQELVGDDEGWQKSWRVWRSKYGFSAVRCILTITPEDAHAK